jgi:hypothetical protein
MYVYTYVCICLYIHTYIWTYIGTSAGMRLYPAGEGALADTAAVGHLVVGGPQAPTYTHELKGTRDGEFSREKVREQLLIHKSSTSGPRELKKKPTNVGSRDLFQLVRNEKQWEKRGKTLDPGICFGS